MADHSLPRPHHQPGLQVAEAFLQCRRILVGGEESFDARMQRCQLLARPLADLAERGRSVDHLPLAYDRNEEPLVSRIGLDSPSSCGIGWIHHDGVLIPVRPS